MTGVTCAPLDHPRTMELVGIAVRHRSHWRRHADAPRAIVFPGQSIPVGAVGRTRDRLDRRAPGVLDLYAGVGLFSVSAAVAGRGPVIAVEGDRFSADDLRRNAEGHDITVNVGAVEKFLERAPPACLDVIVDPPRTGMSKEATAGVIRLKRGAAGLCVVRHCHAGSRCEVAARRGLSHRQRAGVRPVSEHRARRDGHRFRALDACTRPSNSSRNSPVRQKFSGCHCTATQKAASGFSIASTTPSGEVAVMSKPLATSFTDW